MQSKTILAALVVLSVFSVLIAGCLSSEKMQEKAGTDTIESGEIGTNIETPDIVTPDINESEGDFPLPF